MIHSVLGRTKLCDDTIRLAYNNQIELLDKDESEAVKKFLG